MLVRHEPTSAGVVRRRLADDLTAAGVGADVIEEVVLVASELVGNAIRHTSAESGQPLDVTWDRQGDDLVVAVSDGSRLIPRRRDARVDTTGGRGLAIVEAIASSWGVSPTPTGKRVWARLRLRPSS